MPHTSAQFINRHWHTPDRASEYQQEPNHAPQIVPEVVEQDG